MIYYVYELGPCDWWAGFVPVDQYLKGYADEDKGEYNPFSNYDDDAQEWVNKMRMILANYLEETPHTEAVSAMPSLDCNPIKLFCAKISNNGTTYVVSPVPLWHLHQEDKWHTPAKPKLVEWIDPK